MATKDELHTLAMSLFDNAKNDLARDGSVKRNDEKVCIVEAGVDKDKMARTLKALATVSLKRTPSDAALVHCARHCVVCRGTDSYSPWVACMKCGEDYVHMGCAWCEDDLCPDCNDSWFSPPM